MGSSRNMGRLFNVMLYGIAVLFAWFLLQAGGLLIKQLPQTVGSTAYIDLLEEPQMQALIRREEAALKTVDEQKQWLKQAQSKQNKIANTVTSAERIYSDLLAARDSTGDPSINISIEQARKELAHKRTLLSNATEKTDQIDIGLVEAKVIHLNAKDATRAFTRQDTEQRRDNRQWETLKAFVVRLIFVLPLLLLAWWLLQRYRQSKYWPFVHGFTYFAVYTFFFELLPYLPSYGGYVRAFVGIILTLLVGRFAIQKLEAYLAKTRELEKADETVRRAQLQQSEANVEQTFTKLEKGVCPSCDRKLKDPEYKFCVHCGLCIRHDCNSCGQLQLSFNNYCFDCGTPHAGESPSNTPAGSQSTDQTTASAEPPHGATPNAPTG